MPPYYDILCRFSRCRLLCLAFLRNTHRAGRKDENDGDLLGEASSTARRREAGTLDFIYGDNSIFLRDHRRRDLSTTYQLP